MGEKQQGLLFGPVLHGDNYYSVTREKRGVVAWIASATEYSTLRGREMVDAWDCYEPTDDVNRDDWYADWLLAEWSDR